MFGVVVVLSCVLALAATNSVNYCGASMCEGNNTHTYCQYPEGPSEKCESYTYGGLTAEEKKRLLDRINGFRLSMAFGKMRSFPPAKNMLKMRWVEELAREAQRWADQCRPPQRVEEYDTCRDLYSVTVGQCVASMVGKTPSRVEQLVDIWYIQSVHYKVSVRYYVPPGNSSKYYGDFAQLFWAKSFMVGCGRSRFMAPWKGRVQRVERLVCNVAPRGPQPGHSIWLPGPPATSCPEGSMPSDTSRFLCEFEQNQNKIVPPDSLQVRRNLLLNTIMEVEENETLNYLGSIDEVYLTKLAIAKLKNSLPIKAHFNLKQRREVNDSTTVFVPQAVAVQPYVQDSSKIAANTTLRLLTETSTKVINSIQTKYSHELDWVGQPDNYNMEDLDNFNEQTKIIEPTEEIPKRKKKSHVEYGFVTTTNHDTTSKVLLNCKEDPNSTDISEASSTVDNYEDHSSRGASDRQIKEQLYLKEHELQPKGRRPKKVRRELPDDEYVPEPMSGVTRPSHNPLVAILKLIPSLADYNLANYPDIRFHKWMLERALTGKASHVTCDIFTSVFVIFGHIFILFHFVY